MSNHRYATGVPGPLVGLARWLMRKFGVHENVTYGANLRIGRGVVISSPHGLTIGNDVSIGPRSIIQVDGTIGDWTLIGMGVQIVGRDDHALGELGVPVALGTRASERPSNPRDRVTIGRDVWIGGGSTVLSGISIGDCAVVAAGSVLTRDVSPFAIVAGNPASPVGMRFATQKDRETHLRGLSGGSQAHGEALA